MPENMFITTTEDYEAYIGPNSYKYLYNFSKFQALRESFTVTWHWPAFFFGFWWFLYRKMYFWAVISLLVTFLPFGNFIAQIGYGLSAYYLYYRDCSTKINMITEGCNPQNVRHVLQDAGGVHGWVKIVGIICFFLQPVWIFFVTIFFGGAMMLSMHQFMM
jgi:hypothetical protein